MIDFDGIRRQADLVRIIQSYGTELERKGDDWFACCPFHQEDTASFTVFRDPKHQNTQRFKCFGCDASGDVFDFVSRVDGLQSPKQAADRVRELAGVLEQPDSQTVKQPARKAKSDKPKQDKPAKSTTPARIVATYDYVDASGQLVFQSVRYEPKTFRQRRPAGNGWAWNLEGIERPLYRLPEVLQADVVFLTEGEKDADNMRIAFNVCATTNAGGARAKWEPQYSEALRNKTVYIIPDNDDPGRERGALIAHLLHGIAAAVFLIELPGADLGIKDATDFIDASQDLQAFLSFAKLYVPVDPEPELAPQQQPTAQVNQPRARLIEMPSSNGNRNGNGNGSGHHSGPPPSGPDHNWRDLLLRNRYNNPQPWLSNVLIALRHAPEWHGVVWHNEFSQTATARKPFPGEDSIASDTPWSDRYDTLLAEWLQQQAGIAVGTDTVGRAVQCVAEERKYHPVREYLNSLRWDSTGRIDTWLSDYLHVKPSNYSAAVGARWLMSAVARIFQPGSKADCCLILEGEQGKFKSTALETLAVKKEWFTDRISEFGSKDAGIETAGVWIVEFAELDAIKRSAEWSKVKGFISATFDRYRPPYGKRAATFLRQCIFAGSVNHETYLGDETGGRRFWPVLCGGIGIEQLREDRDQLWAEAVVRYQDGEAWWLDSASLVADAEVEQTARYESDPWQDRIDAWLDMKDTVSIAQILEHCIQKPTKDWSQQDRNRVAKCLRAARWIGTNVRNEDGSRERKYRRGVMAKRQQEFVL